MRRTWKGVGVLLLVVAMPGALYAKGAFLPTFHPKPCSGDDCRADDARSGQSCAGLLCSISSAKAMQQPVTASEAAEMEKAREDAAATAANAPPVEPTPPAFAKHQSRTKHVRTAKTAPTANTSAPAPVGVPPAEAAAR